MRRRFVHILTVVVIAASGWVALVAGAGPAGAEPVGLTTVVSTTGEESATCQISTVDVASGSLTALGPVVDDGACPVDYAYTDDGTRVYGVTFGGIAGQSLLVTVDPATGVQTPIGDTGFVVIDGGGLEFDAAGTLWFYGLVDDEACGTGDPASCLYRMDVTTGTGTLVGSAPEDLVEVAGMTRECSGALFSNAFELAEATGADPEGADEADAGAAADEAAGDPPLAASAEGPGIPGAPAGSIANPGAVGAQQLGDGGHLLTVDTATAGLGLIGPLGGTQVASGLAFDDGGELWAIVLSQLVDPLAREWYTARIDPATGTATRVADLPVSLVDPFQTVYGLTLGPTPPCPAIELQPTFTG